MTETETEVEKLVLVLDAGIGLKQTTMRIDPSATNEPPQLPAYTE